MDLTSFSLFSPHENLPIIILEEEHTKLRAKYSTVRAGFTIQFSHVGVTKYEF
jgi:hypothetical protein